MQRTGLVLCSGMLVVAALMVIGQQVPATMAMAQDAAKSCVPSLLLNFSVSRDGEHIRDVPIWQLPGSSAFFFDAGMTVDADGAPNAYNPQNTGLDDLANAGEPGHWDGLAKDENGNPYIQGPADPFPGFYVSCTALTNRNKDNSDPAKYVDASKIPYVVLPGDLASQTGARLGDLFVVFNLRNGRSTYAIFGDIGTMGEGSVALAERLRIDSNARGGRHKRRGAVPRFPRFW